MGLDVYLKEVKPCTIWAIGITHNLTAMAEAAGLYECMWRPEEICITLASQMIHPLECGIAVMEQDKEKLKKLNPENGFGNYEFLLSVAQRYLAACKEHPNATVEACR